MRIFSKQSQIDDLKRFLSSYGVDYSSWGENATKTIEQLLAEIQKGDCILGITQTNQVVRLVSVVAVDVLFKKNDVLFELFEQEQVFSDGSKRVRNLNSSLAEKIQSHESTEDALVRMTKEELNLAISADRFVVTTMGRTDSNESKSYPGLFSRFSFRDYHLFLNSEEYNQDGYVEKQIDKKTYFTWREVVPAV